MSQTFTKVYTRNFSIIMQEAWFAAHQDIFSQRVGCSPCPYQPPYVYFMNDGVEEVWENNQAHQWFLDRLAEKFAADEAFFPAMHRAYFDQLAEMEQWWKKDITTAEGLKVFMEKVYEGVSLFVILYNALAIHPLSSSIKEAAVEFREKDVFFAECNAAIWRALQNIYPDFGYLVVYITHSEIGLLLTKEELQKRDAGFVLIPEVLQSTMSFADLQKKFPDIIFEGEDAKDVPQEIKGQVAFKGVVSGTVRIVRRADQIAAVKEGEIIVSPMTTPDFLPAMKRAAAFITDEGGITCHAAIIARELQKPCITGTKIATKILKDGDIVEVDAEKGIVRKISIENTQGRD